MLRLKAIVIGVFLRTCKLSCQAAVKVIPMSRSASDVSAQLASWHLGLIGLGDGSECLKSALHYNPVSPIRNEYRMTIFSTPTRN